MRSLQKVLLIIGATAVGSAWGCIAVALIAALTVARARSGEDWGTGLGVMYAGACCGFPLGAIAGFAGALRIAEVESEDWSLVVWIGVALGAAVGLASCHFNASQLRFDWISLLIVAVVTVTFGTVGGMTAAVGEGTWRRITRGRSQFATTVLGLVCASVVASLLLGLVTMLVSRQLTALQFAWSILIGIPILCGALMWLRRGRRALMR